MSVASRRPLPAMTGADDDSRPFALALCTLVLLPWALKKLRTAASTQTEMAKWRTLGFSAAAPVVQKEQRLAGSGWSRHASWRNALFAALLATEALLVQEAWAEPPVVPPFDPYATEGSNPGLADPRQVRYSHVRAVSWTGMRPSSWTRRSRAARGV